MRMYWSKDALYSTPIFFEVMSCDCFELIVKFFNFNNNSTYNPTDENRDHLHKVQPLIEALCERCQTIYYPGQNLSVDESFVLLKGRLHFKQLICTKRAHFGIKLYELCTSSVPLFFFWYACCQQVTNQIWHVTIGGQPGRKPFCVKYYNHHMGGVDSVDQQLHYQHTLKNSYKWYHKLAL